ncbi:Uncharacterized protein APZ42_016690 [Daphnia magna]|uniref:Uncharacterized protein n=1 Tax=Daphnia magna TaxID=35525 RepID=A0A165A3J6_9CRUS|nr:Uncharacterized protein APZ42_016690 [Daphnia magna]
MDKRFKAKSGQLCRCIRLSIQGCMDNLGVMMLGYTYSSRCCFSSEKERETRECNGALHHPRKKEQKRTISYEFFLKQRKLAGQRERKERKKKASDDVSFRAVAKPAIKEKTPLLIIPKKLFRMQ